MPDQARPVSHNGRRAETLEARQENLWVERPRATAERSGQRAAGGGVFERLGPSASFRFCPPSTLERSALLPASPPAARRSHRRVIGVGLTAARGGRDLGLA